MIRTFDPDRMPTVMWLDDSAPDVVEYGNTDQLFTKPAKKQTEDYITGRYG